MSNESKESQRFRNLVILGAWATDEEMGEMAPFLGILILLALLVVGGYVCYNKNFKEPKEDPKAIVAEDKNPAKPIDSLKITIGDSI